tara:strand:- start:819 stop:947 length:129 start_codon:yes stop_codon:yes gene_type:complete
MSKALKKIKKIKAELDKVEAKEETLFEDLDEAIDELEEEQNE